MASPTLPGQNTVINDLGLKVAPPPVGPKVTLLGVTSNTGVKINEPFTVSSVERAMNTLYFENASGDMIPGELALAVEAASNGGATNIEVVVIGHYQGLNLENYTSVTGDAASRYNDLAEAYDAIRERDLDVVAPVGVFMDQTLTGVGVAGKNFGKQLADFCYQSTVQGNSCVGVIGTRPVMEWALSHWEKLREPQGSPGLTNSQLADEIETLFLDGTLTTVDPVKAAASVKFAQPSKGLVDEWVRYHSLPTATGQFLTEVVTEYDAVYKQWLYGAADSAGNFLNDVPDTAGSVHPDYFVGWQATDINGNSAVDARSVKVDAGAYLSVFTAPVQVSTSLIVPLATSVGVAPTVTRFNGNGAYNYAGRINSLAAKSSTTNKTVTGLTPLRLLSQSQAGNLNGMRHVTMFNRTRGFVVVEGRTGAHFVNNYIKSDFTGLTTVRITQAAVDLIRAATEVYIGEPINGASLNSLRNEINNVLAAMQSQGALNEFAAEVTSAPNQRVLGVVDVDLVLVVANELRRINLTVSLAKSLS